MRLVSRMLALVALIALCTPDAIARTKPLKGTPLPKLLDKAKKDGVVPVIVGVRLDEEFVAEGKLTKEKRDKQRKAIKDAQERVAKKHPRVRSDRSAAFRSVPHMIVLADAETLAALAEDDDVVRIEEERVGTIILNASTAHVNAPTVWSVGQTGSGWAVAQLDTGVQKTHPMLNGKIDGADEGCFARNFTQGTDTYEASCATPQPNQTLVSQTGNGTSAACVGHASCGHGTQTAAIAVGQNGFANNATLHGVARGASLVPINVITFRVQNNVRRLASFEGDHIRAFDFILDRVEAGRQIAAINISLNMLPVGYDNQATCDGHDGTDDTPADDNAYYQAVANLRSQKVLVVAGSGNNNANAVAFPACLSNAIAVGATARASDAVAQYSNAGDMLDIWAPGGTYDDPGAGTCAVPTVLCLTTATTNSGYISSVGTSFSSPHVAGAVAVLRGRLPNAPVEKLIEVLTTTGPQITDWRTPTPRRRLDLSAAYNAMDTQAPTAPSVSAFATTTTNVRIQWSGATDNVGVTHYRVQRRSTLGGANSGWSYLPGTVTGSWVDDSTVAAGKAYEYRVEAYDAFHNPSPLSAGDIAVTVLFDDDPIAVQNAPPVAVRGVHLAQVREAIDGWRELAGLSRLWGPPYAAATGLIQFSHFNELTGTSPWRGFDEARQLLGRPAFTFSQGAPQQGGVARASHMQDLRNALK